MEGGNAEERSRTFRSIRTLLIPSKRKLFRFRLILWILFIVHTMFVRYVSMWRPGDWFFFDNDRIGSVRLVHLLVVSFHVFCLLRLEDNFLRTLVSVIVRFVMGILLLTKSGTVLYIVPLTVMSYAEIACVVIYYVLFFASRSRRAAEQNPIAGLSVAAEGDGPSDVAYYILLVIVGIIPIVGPAMVSVLHATRKGRLFDKKNG